MSIASVAGKKQKKLRSGENPRKQVKYVSTLARRGIAFVRSNVIRFFPPETHRLIGPPTCRPSDSGPVIVSSSRRTGRNKERGKRDGHDMVNNVVQTRQTYRFICFTIYPVHGKFFIDRVDPI